MRFSRCALQLLAATASTTSVVADDFSKLSPTASAAAPRQLSAKGDKTPTPSETPTMDPSELPSMDPSAFPSIDPSTQPSESMDPSQAPTMSPSMGPSVSMLPSWSDVPTTNPSSSVSPTTEAEKIKIFNHTGAPQYYTIPKTGIYTMTAVGAKGGDCYGCMKSTCNYFTYVDNPFYTKIYWCQECEAQYHEGGYGVLVRGKFLLHKGDKLEVIVGGKGQDCKKVPRVNFSGAFIRTYLEARTGAGGGGASSVQVKRDGKGDPELLLIAGGGGGSGFFFNGEDGEAGPNGGFGWGGQSGQGGELGPSPPPEQPQFGGAGGAGVYGNGASRKAKWNGQLLDRDEEVWAEGGFSLSNGSQGGYVDRHGIKSIENVFLEAQSGSAGGYGGGGQGGSGEYLLC